MQVRSAQISLWPLNWYSSSATAVTLTAREKQPWEYGWCNRSVELIDTTGICAGEALRLLEQCKELAPTLPELYTVQSRILKHAGDPQGAAEAACKAESMDLADR